MEQQQSAGLLAELRPVTEVDRSTPLLDRCVPQHQQLWRHGTSAFPRPHHRCTAASPTAVPPRVRLRAQPSGTQPAAAGGCRLGPDGRCSTVAGPSVVSRRGTGRRRATTPDRPRSPWHERNAEPYTCQERSSGHFVINSGKTSEVWTNFTSHLRRHVCFSCYWFAVVSHCIHQVHHTQVWL